MRSSLRLALLATVLFSTASAARAEDAAPLTIWQRGNLLGDLGGLRPWAVDHGVTLTITEQSEIKGNTTGGTLPLCLWDWQNQLKKGDNLILATFGGGFTWGAMWMKWAF